MKKYKLISILLCGTLLLTPCISYAEEEGEPVESTPTETTTPTPSPEPSPDPSQSPEPTPSETPVEVSIKLDKDVLNLTIKEKDVLKAKVVGTNDKVEWTTGDANVATVLDGNVVAVGIGETNITATVGGKSAVCKVVVKEKEVESPKGTDATLKSVTISNGKLDKTFKPDVFEYTVILDENSKSINLSSYTKTDSKAKVSEFKTESSVKLVVTSEDEKTTNTYVFTVFKDEVSLNLKSLSINGYAFNEEFDSTKTKYTADIPYEIDTLTINAVPEADSSKVTVTITNTKNLKLGANQIKVTVKDEKGNSKIYEIIATRNEETKMDGKPTSIITSDLINNNTVSDAIATGIDSNTNNSSSPDNFIKYFIVSLACLILFAIGGIGIYFYVKTSPRKLRKELATLKKQNEEIEETPMIVVEEKPVQPEESKKDIEMYEEIDLMATKQFKREDLNNMIEVLDIKDEEDV